VTALDLSPLTVVLLCLIPFLAWRIYRRTRRMVGRQLSTARRHWFGIGFYSALLLLLGLHSLSLPESLLSLVGGIAFGAALAVVGLRLTRFERTAEGYFYTPNAHIGVALSAIFGCRIAYRFVELYVLGTTTGVPPDFVRSPLTLITLGMLAGYFVVYAIGVLRWRAQQKIDRANANAGADSA
jgi:hypothetical protein